MQTGADLIRRVPLFAQLAEADAEAVAQAAERRRFRRGEKVLGQGETSGMLVVVIDGRVRVLATDRQGREVILGTVAAGEHIGEMSLLDNKPHSATCRAETATEALLLSRAEFARCLPRSSAMAMSVMRLLTQRLRAANRQIESLALYDVYGRLARKLLELSAPGDDGRRVIGRHVSHQDLAKMIGSSREVVSRAMKDFQQRGLVQAQEDGCLAVVDAVGGLT